MFKSIQTTEVMFTKRPRIRTRGPIVGQKRQDTPRPTEEEFLSILTNQMSVQEDPVKETVKEEPIKKTRSHSI